jgi:type VI secretion system protein VasG
LRGRGGSKILVEDLLLGLLERPHGLLARALQDADVDAGELSAALQSRVEHSASRNPVFAPELVQWLQDALLVANLELGQTQVEEAALILALLRNPMRYAGSRYQPLLAKLNIDRLKEFALSQQEQPAANGKAGGAGRIAAAALHPQPDPTGPRRQARPGAVPRWRDPPDGRHPRPTPQEQPDRGR